MTSVEMWRSTSKIKKIQELVLLSEEGDPDAWLLAIEETEKLVSLPRNESIVDVDFSDDARGLEVTTDTDVVYIVRMNGEQSRDNTKFCQPPAH